MSVYQHYTIGGGKRQSNIELCRILSIVMVMLLHSDFAVFGWPKSMDSTSIAMLALESFCIIGVNVFVLITGYFSTKPKTKSLVNLVYICFFWWVLKMSYNVIAGNEIPLTKLFFFTRSNWFIPTYLGLILFAPALNALCEKLDKKQLGITILSLLAFETYMGYCPAMPQIPVGFNGGCSILSFMVLYLIGRYIKLYGLPLSFQKASPYIYIICSCIIAFQAFSVLTYFAGNPHVEKLLFKVFDYNSPFIILSAVSFFLIFSRLNIGVILSINHIAKSVLAVLLVHACGEVMAFTSPQFIYIYNHYSGITLIALWIMSIVIVFLFAVLLDQIRLYTYKYIKRIIFKN